jgi:hypothetical protein
MPVGSRAGREEDRVDDDAGHVAQQWLGPHCAGECRASFGRGLIGHTTVVDFHLVAPVNRFEV